MIISLWKNKGISSLELYEYSKKYLKCGHAGTLDYYAEGIVPILTDNSTKFQEKINILKKTYFFGFTVGISTTSLDINGNITKKSYNRITKKILEEKLVVFCEKYKEIEYMQESPIYSAKKQNGIPNYKNNPSNIKIKFNKVKIYKLKFFLIADNTAFGIVECSKGFYVRSLIKEIGDFIKLPTTTIEICRTSIGPFNVINSIKTIRNHEHTKRKRNKRFKGST